MSLALQLDADAVCHDQSNQQHRLEQAHQEFFDGLTRGVVG